MSELFRVLSSAAKAWATLMLRAVNQVFASQRSLSAGRHWTIRFSVFLCFALTGFIALPIWGGIALLKSSGEAIGEWIASVHLQEK